MVAKKKARHLYEILGKGAAQPGSQQEVSPTEGAKPLQEEESARFPETFLPKETPSDKALENAFIVRKDTAVMGMILLAIVMWIIGFFVGRWTAQKTLPAVKPTLKESAAAAEPPPILLPGQETTESAGTASGVKEKYYLVIAAYDESQRRYADEAAEFLRSKEYPVVIEKSGDKLTIRLRGFQSNSDPQALKIQGEIRSLEYKGRKEFRTAYFVQVK
jgi:hypothetical protein